MMSVPVPLLAAGLVLLVVLFWLALRRRGDRDLLAPPPSLRAVPPPLDAPSVRPAPAAAPAPVDLESQLKALLAGGRKIEAIKRLREATGLGLAEAKDWVETIERGGAVDLPPAASEPDDVYDEIRALLATNQKLAAIKRLREATGLGLAEAKARVESIAREFSK